MIFVIRGVPHPAIPAAIDGLRTRVRESSRFRAGYRGLQQHRACTLPAKRSAAQNSIQPALTTPRR